MESKNRRDTPRRERERGRLIGRSALLGPGPAAAVRAQEQKKAEAPKPIRRSMATVTQPTTSLKHDGPKPIRRSTAMVTQPTTRRALGDTGNLINGRIPLANRKKPVVVAAEKCVTVVPQAAARSRRALIDVSNLINGRRPTLANRQKAVAVPADRHGQAVKLKESNKPKPEVSVISSDSMKEKKASRGQRASRRAPIQTLTSILTKCSRASDGMISSPSKMQSYEIDAPDALNELAVVEYVEDIYSFYKSTESACLPFSTYMSIQSEINERMRAILIDWIIEVQHRLKLMPESLYLTVYIIDQYLSNENVPKKELQLVGVSAMLIATKYEEIWAPLVKDLLCISDNAFSREQVLRTEKAILNKLQWNLTVPTMYMFIARYMKAAMGDKELENMAFFYAELALVQYSMLVYSPSLTAAAAVYAARCTMDINPHWSNILEHHTGLAESEIKSCARRLVSLHLAAPESKQKAVYRKYSNPKLSAVSLYSPAKKLLTCAATTTLD